MTSETIDVEEIVRDWAWEMFDKTKSKDQGKIPRDTLDMTVNWKRVKFVYGKPDFKDAVSTKVPRTQVLFKTFFSNNTQQEQEYSFKTERTTSSTCTVEISKGVTTGYEASIKLQTPCEVFQANAGFKREVLVENVDGQTTEESLTWAVDSQIKVPARHKTTAELVITEEEYRSVFTIKSRFQGRILVTITNTKDNNSLVKCLEGNMADIFKREIENGLSGFRVEKKDVCYETLGKCHFRFGVEQHVKLNQFPLGKEE